MKARQWKNYKGTALLKKNTINAEEISKFSDASEQWWSMDGPFAQLHLMNHIRLDFILSHYDYNVKDKKILDAGCGGGISSIPLARLGAKVTGIDASLQSIHIAQKQAHELKLDINYKNSDICDLSDKYDIIICLEVIEHVDNLSLFLTQLNNLLKPNGVLFISTINRTIKSYLATIIGAEHILKWVPKGTHDWNKFISPLELQNLLPNLTLINLKGMKYNPFKNEWHLSTNTEINYIASFKKIK